MDKSVPTNGNGKKRTPRAGGWRCVPGKAVYAKDLTRADRARLSSGTNNLAHVVDGRTLIAKRYRRIASQLVADQGGDVAEARLQLIQRFAGAAVLAELVETRIIAGETVDLTEYSQLISSLVRIAGRIGLDRVAKNITPSLKDYLHQKPVEIDAEADGDSE